ncbi:DUF2508 family protein [Paenibacillus thalictri]|uniref:DUF2508 family protein n=1 Tax=Paenibacillus thalictri TaxID=2527873 RepID=A0A4Q9DHX8_9BACL|nr:DUF2508 family protein [Paenibacillus thalictri]TBL72613.1 DUF2508 family protein [Paenibacillus thalictri]
MQLWPNSRKEQKMLQLSVRKDQLSLIQEIRSAQIEWVTAQKRFDYVCEREQIDYAIYALEAAEKRYEMLLRLAKRLHVASGDAYLGHALEVSES